MAASRPGEREAASLVLGHDCGGRLVVEIECVECGVAAVASKVLDWDGTGTDFVDAGLTWFGMGYKRHAGSPLRDVPAEEHDVAKDVLFGTGSAMFVRAAVFADLCPPLPAR